MRKTFLQDSEQPLPNLKEMLYFKPGDLHALVYKVVTRDIQAPSKIDLLLGLRRLANQERAAALEPNSKDALRHRKHCEIIKTLVDKLSAAPLPETDDEITSSICDLYLDDHKMIPVMVLELTFSDYPAVSRFLDDCGHKAKSSLRFFGDGNSTLANMPRWHKLSSFDFPTFVVRDQDGQIMAVFTIFRDSQWVGTIGLCSNLVDDCGEYLEKLLNLAATMGESRFCTVQVQTVRPCEAVFTAFNKAGFDHCVMQNVVPDGNGGVEDYLVFYRKLRTDEDYLNAGD